MSLPTEFDKTGVTYYAVAPEGYVYSTEQTAQYGTRKYTTLAACVAAMPYTPTTPFVVNILGSWSSALGTSTWSGPTFTATNYLIIRCIGEARHNGVYSTTAARISVTSGYGLQIYTAYTTVEGLQFVAGTPSSDIYMVGMYSSSSDVLDSCIIKGYGGTPSNYMWGVEVGAAGVTLKNNVIYDWGSSVGGGVGIAPEYAANYYNNTIRNCEYGFYSYATDGVATNNVVQDCASGCYYGTSAFTGSNNVADDSTAPGTAKITGEVAFENESAGNFQLTIGDTVARGAGVTLAAVDDDITGTTRTIHSCGAFEGATGGGGNSVTESELPAFPTETQDVTQPTVVTSTEAPARSVETSTASQANAVASTELPAIAVETASVTQLTTVVSSESPARVVTSQTVTQPNVVVSTETHGLPSEVSTTTQRVEVVSAEVLAAPIESSTVFVGNTVASTEAPVLSLETASTTQRVEAASAEAPGLLVETSVALVGVTVACVERPSLVVEFGAATQQTVVTCQEVPGAPSETCVVTQPVSVTGQEQVSLPVEMAAASQGTAVISFELSSRSAETATIAQPFVVVSSEGPFAATETATATETWAISSTELLSRAVETQAVEQYWTAESNEIPRYPIEAETVGWSYLVTGVESSGAAEFVAIQQPFVVVSVETTDGVVELSRVYRPSHTLGGTVSITVRSRSQVALSVADRNSIKLTLVDYRGISITIN